MLGFLGLLGVLAVAPEAVKMILLMLAWTGGAVTVLWSVADAVLAFWR